jgi:hypothetical protein
VIYKKALALFLCFGFIPQQTYAAGEVGIDPPSLLLEKKNAVPPTNSGEFIYQPYPGTVLIPVSLWGSVTRTGIYRIPLNTDLVTLLSLAGGPGVDAKIDDISIRRTLGPEQKVITVDGEKLIKGKDKVPVPVLAANDVVYVPKKEPVVSNNTVLMITVVASVLSVIVSTLVIREQLNR